MELVIYMCLCLCILCAQGEDVSSQMEELSTNPDTELSMHQQTMAQMSAVLEQVVQLLHRVETSCDDAQTISALAEELGQCKAELSWTRQSLTETEQALAETKQALAATKASDVKVFMQYLSKGIPGYNSAWSSDLETVRTCMDDCISKGVTNLRSVDYKKDRSSCACQPVNFKEVAMSWYADWDSYQYIVTLTDAAVYSCHVTRSSMKQESNCEQLGVGTAFTDGIIIVEEGKFPFTSQQIVASRSRCTDLCLQDPRCNAYVIEKISGGFPATCSMFYNL